jgi:small subunit ribosomal protein S1
VVSEKPISAPSDASSENGAAKDGDNPAERSSPSPPTPAENEAAVNEATETPHAATDQPSAAAPASPRKTGDDSSSAPADAGAKTDQATAKTEEAAPGGGDHAHARRRVRNPAIARAFRSGRPVQGKVEHTIKGGYEVRIGRARAFCPFSQMDVRRVEQPEAHEGKQYLFRVIQFRRGGEDIVVSRRVLLEEERNEEAKAVYATLIEGSVMLGHVASIADFGAFVDLGAGVLGLVHISELAHTRVDKVGDAVKLGDPVIVKILKIDTDKHRISLSIRQAQEDPWLKAAREFKVGESYLGKVLRQADFGAFVEMAEGVEALAHARDVRPTPEGWQAALPPGHEGRWLVMAIEPDRHRLAVAPAPEEGAPPPPEIKQGATLTGLVKKAERSGVLVWLAPGKVGFVPAPWTGVPRGKPLNQEFATAREIEVEVVDVDADGQRIRLGIKGVAREPLAPPRERRPAKRESTPRTQSVGDAGTFGTSLGDALRDAFSKRDGGS